MEINLTFLFFIWLKRRRGGHIEELCGCVRAAFAYQSYSIRFSQSLLPGKETLIQSDIRVAMGKR